MPMTTDDAQKLVQRSDELVRRMADLAIDAADVATALASKGAPAPDAFLRELGEVGRLFAGIRAEAFEAAASLELPLPPANTVTTATDLKTMLAALLTSVAAAERQTSVAAARASAVSVLERVDLLSHVDHADFEALQTCQERARTLREMLEQRGAEPEGAAITPFAALLRFVDSHDHLDDERWGALQDTITSAFGATLAMAAGRGRLVTASSALECVRSE